MAQNRKNPDASRGPLARAQLGKIVQRKHGHWKAAGVHFYDYTVSLPMHGMINIPYMRDITHLQMKQAGGRMNESDKHRRKMLPRVRGLDAIITMTDELAAQFRSEFGVDVPHGLFRCYPTGIRSPKHKRQEIVYIDNQSMRPVGFDQHLRELDKLSKATSLPTKFVSRRMGPEARAIVKRRRFRVEVVDLPVYDYASAYGVLQNPTSFNFNQAGVALNRKLLIYLAAGMNPIVHETFLASIRYLRGCKISPLTWSLPGDVAKHLASHSFGTWDPAEWDMDRRVPDLKAEINRLSTIVRKRRRGSPVRGKRGRGPTPKVLPVTVPANPLKVAICLPCHASTAEQVGRTVMALRHQAAKPEAFEVVVAVDGGDPTGAVRAVVMKDHPFAVQVVDSPRPHGNIPHRNHARNAAWQASSAPLCWMLDSDMMLLPRAVEDLIHEWDESVKRGLPAVFSPVMRSFHLPPTEWIARSRDWFETGDSELFGALLADVPRASDVYAGHAEHYTRKGPASMTFDVEEGMPCVPRRVLKALGGFDELYTGWGGNKEELVYRLLGLKHRGLLDMRLLTSAVALHQPHSRPKKAIRQQAGNPHQRRREHMARDIKAKRPWWEDQVSQAIGALVLVRRGIVDTVTASLASIPTRRASLEKVVEALLPQVDRLNVYLNGYPDVPPFLKRPSITVERSQDHGDLGDRGKMFWAEKAQGYYVTCDDDIAYPPDYVSTLIRRIEDHGRRVIVGVHGATLNNTVRHYYRDRTVTHFAESLGADKAVHILGTGTTAWHTATLDVRMADFPEPNMADVWLGLLAQRKKIPMASVARAKKWIGIVPGSQKDTIYDLSHKIPAANCPQTKAIKAIKWGLLPIDPVVAAAKSGRGRGKVPRIDPGLAELIAIAARGNLKGPALAIVTSNGVGELAAKSVQGSTAMTVEELLQARGLSGVIFADYLWKTDSSGMLCAIDAARRAVVGGMARVVFLEPTLMGNKGTRELNGHFLRAPLDYQRLVPGLGVRKQFHHGGMAWTLLAGRLRK